MNTHASWWKRFVIPALLSTMASLLIVSVGPAFSEPSDQAKGGNSADHGNSEEAHAANGNDRDPGGGAAVETAAATSTADAGSQTGPGNGNGHDKGKGNKHADESTGSASSDASAGPGTGSKHGPDPDPVQTQTPPATHGPTTCPGYSQSSGGPYDHDNCDGSQGQNGNGGNGKCPGCTGKADDKHPGGQYPGDHNNGYECDHNRGVGKGNPAHSRCADTPPPPCPDLDPNTPGVQCNPVLDCTGDTNPNNNQSCNPRVCPPNTDRAGQPIPLGGLDFCDDEILGDRINNDGDIGGTLQERPVTQRKRILPFTGASMFGYLLLALELMVVGLFVMRASRRCARRPERREN